MDPEPKVKNLPLAIWPDWTPKILAYLTTLGFFISLGGLYFFEIPTGNKEALLLMLGCITTAWLGVMAYYYNQTAGNVSREAVKANTEAQVTAATKVTTQKEPTPEG